MHYVAAKLLAVVQQREQEPLDIAAFLEATVQLSKQDAGSKCPGICLHGSYAHLRPETTEREGRALLGDVPFLHETSCGWGGACVWRCPWRNTKAAQRLRPCHAPNP